MNRWSRFVLPACIVLVCARTIPLQAQFLHVNGKKIIDDSSNEIIFRGIGLGGWMLQEGYMLETGNFANTQHEIRQHIQTLIGTDNTNQFYTAWLANHCTRQDIDSLAKWGFNSVRLPMHYNLYTLPIQSEPTPGVNTWIDTGFILTDSLVKWCSDNHIYVILDLHAAPGGQGRDASISDYESSKPSLWESVDNRNKTVALWKKLAQRYANEPWVAGYDLINEPNWNFTPGLNGNGCDETNNGPLFQLYSDITAAIRTVDTRHLIFVEGNCWASNYTGFYKWDNNQVMSFHKYWSNNDIGSIQNDLNIRDKNGVALWLGESGENSNQWFKDAITLAETNDIGWAWWPMKKINNIVGPLTVIEDPDYRTLLNYWTNGGTAPTVSFATNALLKQADNLKVSKNIHHKDVIDAMFRQRTTNSTIPFSRNSVPGKIFFTDFDLGSNGYAYYDHDVANYQTSSGIATVWNQGNSYRNDGVDIEKPVTPDPAGNGYDVWWTEKDEWMQYTAQVDSLSGYDIAITYASSGGTKLRLTTNDQTFLPSTVLPSSGGLQTWSTVTLHDVILSKGQQRIKAIIDAGGMKLSSMSFTYGSKSSNIPFSALDGETFQSTENIIVNFNKSIDPATLTSVGLTCRVNSTVVTINNLVVSGTGNSQISFDLNQTITDADTITVSYSGTTIKATDGSQLTGFSDLPIRNNLPLHLLIPGTIQAENFAANSGLVAEACKDAGSGMDMGYTDAGDYLEYNIRVNKNDSYTLEVRYACNSNAGTIEVQQLDDAGATLHFTDIELPVTGGWQTWNSALSNITLTAGVSHLRVRIIQAGFNLNWYKFTANLTDAVEPLPGFSFYPNPAKRSVTLQMPPNLATEEKKITIINSLGQAMRLPNIEDNVRNTLFISLDGLNPGMYILVLQSVKGVWRFKVMVE